MYRPEGWENPYSELKDGDEGAYKYCATHTLANVVEAYEAGADAILEGLKKHPSAGRTDGATKEYTVLNPGGVEGTFVFIPEEE